MPSFPDRYLKKMRVERPPVRRSVSASALPSPREPDRSKKARLQDVSRIRVVVRNRPLSRKELEGSMASVLTVPDSGGDEFGPAELSVTEPKVKVDMTAYTEQHRFLFDAVCRSSSSSTPPPPKHHHPPSQAAKLCSLKHASDFARSGVQRECDE